MTKTYLTCQYKSCCSTIIDYSALNFASVTRMLCSIITTDEFEIFNRVTTQLQGDKYYVMILVSWPTHNSKTLQSTLGFLPPNAALKPYSFQQWNTLLPHPCSKNWSFKNFLKTKKKLQVSKQLPQFNDWQRITQRSTPLFFLSRVIIRAYSHISTWFY